MSPQSSDPELLSNRWTILAAMLVVLVMAPLDASAVNVILPILQAQFHLTLAQVAWVPLIYLLVLASLILPAGRFGDLHGFRRIYLTGAVLFTLASAWCGFAPTFGWLIAGRVLQAVGACMLMALSSGIVTAIFPGKERGAALGMVGMAIAIGLVIGPTLGGFLTALGGWRLIFFINLPIGLVGTLLCLRLLPAIRPHPGAAIDWAGAGLAILTLSSLLLALTQGEAWGWTSPAVLTLGAVGVGCAVLFVRVEGRSRSPLLDLALFRHPVFAWANFALTMNYLGQFCATFLVPKLLQDALHLSVARTGLVMVALPAAILLLAPISGALSTRIGTRPLVVIGESLVALGLAGLAFAAPGGHLPFIIAALVVVGIGAGIFQAPNNSAIMGSVPHTHLGVGGGVLATMRNIGMALGIAASSVVAVVAEGHYLARHPGLVAPALLHGIQLAFFVGALFAALGALASAVRPNDRAGSVST